MTMRLWSALLLALAILSAGPAHALLPSAPDTEAEATPAPPSATIDAEADAGADDRIAGRLRGIFAEIPALADVTLEVDAGVVSLSGTVPEREDIARAEEIASRVSGVVTVQNGIERDTSVDSGIGALSGFKDRVSGWIDMAPLALAALVVALVIAGFGYLIASFAGIWHRLAPNSFLSDLIRSAIRFAFVVGGLLVGLDMIGAGTLLGAVLGGAGVIGLALGFAMRDTVENYVASLFLSLRQPFRANDHVLIDDREGRVIRLTSRATILMTLDGNHLRIPNAQVFKAVILNYTTNPNRRFDFELGIDADDDPDAARRLGRETMAALPYLLSDPAPEARTVQVGDSNIVIQFLGWVDQRDADWYRAKSRTIADVKRALEDGGFGLPEPIYRLRFDPRTGPLPFENIEASGKSAGQASPAPAPRSAAPSDTQEDVAPRDEIADMVARERAATSDGRPDLLDSSKPVE
ncbi:mechanosensitive ion channel domain-containing protein [Altererythrobacter sp. CAU 1778]